MHRIILCVALALTIGSIAFSQSETNRNADQNSQPDEKIYTTKEVSKRSVIRYKPVPAYTVIAREHRVEGTVVLRSVFRSTGKVTNIVAVRGLPDGLTEEAIKAARAIKFKPAEKDGRPVSTYVQMEYYFSL